MESKVEQVISVVWGIVSAVVVGFLLTALFSGMKVLVEGG